MKIIKSIVKVIATIVACLAFVAVTGEAEDASMQLLWSGCSLLALVVSYKALVWADPSLSEEDDNV